MVIRSFKSFTTAFFSFFFWITTTLAQIPPAYYDPASGKTGTELQTALHNIIKNHTVKTYDYIWTAFQTTDDKANGTVWDMYSDIADDTPPYVYHFGTNQCGNYNSEGDCYNREHSWPKSWFNDVPPMNTDIFHIYPTDGYVNGQRSNYPYGTVSTASWTSQNGSKLGTCNWPGYSGIVFEPIDEYKGDFARTYFYMSTRYYTEDGNWKVTEMTNESQLKPWALQMMLTWSDNDPVSVKETDRNNTLYGIQNNRNPFIDHPEYANQIWGYPAGVEEKTVQNFLTLFPNPATDHCQTEFPVALKDQKFQLSLGSSTGATISPPYLQAGNTLTIDVKTLPPGIYVVTLAGHDGIWHGKLMKE